MMPAPISRRIVLDRLAWVSRMMAVAEGYRGWFAAHPELLDETL